MKAAIYTLEMETINGERIIKLAYTPDIKNKLKSTGIIPSFIQYTNNKALAASFVAEFNDDYKDKQLVAGFFPIKYSTLITLRFEDLTDRMLKRNYPRLNAGVIN